MKTARMSTKFWNIPRKEPGRNYATCLTAEDDFTLDNKGQIPEIIWKIIKKYCNSMNCYKLGENNRFPEVFKAELDSGVDLVRRRRRRVAAATPALNGETHYTQ